MPILCQKFGGWHYDGVMKSTSFKLSGKSGFSLVELLVVIAVIAIIAAIAIPNIANITKQAGYAKDQRNAQNIASVASAAKAAGAVADLSKKATVIGLLEGTILTTNGGQVLSFGISPLSAAEETGAGFHLVDGANTNTTVSYSPTTGY
jgi:type IV pilus assembly protein PilA